MHCQCGNGAHARDTHRPQDRRRVAPGGVADLRRLAQDHGVDVRLAGHHRGEIGIVGGACCRGVPAGDGDQFGALDMRDCGQMLVAGDLAPGTGACETFAVGGKTSFIVPAADGGMIVGSKSAL